MRTLLLIVVSTVIAGLALDGISFFATGKGLSSRVLSSAMRQDCGMWRLLMDPKVGTLCRSEHDDTATAVAIASDDDAAEAPGSATVPAAAPSVPSGIISADAAGYRGDTFIVDVVDAMPLANIDLEAGGVAEASAPTDIATLADAAEVPSDIAPNVEPLPTVTSPTTDDLATTPAAVPASAENRKATYLVVGSFRRMKAADQLAERLIDLPAAVALAVVGENVFFRVVTGPFAKNEMDAARAKFATLGIRDFWAISLCTVDLSIPPCVARQKTVPQRNAESEGDTVDFGTAPLATVVLEADRAAGIWRPIDIPPPVEAEVPTDTVSSVVPLPAATSPATIESRDIPASDATLADYRIGAGDRLSITVFGHDDLSGEFLVDGLGRVSYPLLGRLYASDKTITELQTDIRTALDRGYIVNPRVSIEVANYRPFFILGQVNSPGGYSYIEGMTVRTAVALAGGFTRRANKDNVVIVRANDPDRKLGDAGLDAEVLPGDTIDVRRRLF